MQLDGPQTAYIRRKARSRPVRLNAVQIANERRFVQGLGYIRADAKPYRSKEVKW
ncbi:hypothetical protein BDV93DRAFT_556716 [Ceratobasidium sp. AG-I]|nr:hypothetical protein BDV93DRAFT_556716 [Ceratobasidium sp. AG-I]